MCRGDRSFSGGSFSWCSECSTIFPSVLWMGKALCSLKGIAVWSLSRGHFNASICHKFSSVLIKFGNFSRKCDVGRNKGFRHSLLSIFCLHAPLPPLARGWLDQVSSSMIRELSRCACPLQPMWFHLHLLAHFIAKALSEFNKNHKPE